MAAIRAVARRALLGAALAFALAAAPAAQLSAAAAAAVADRPRGADSMTSYCAGNASDPACKVSPQVNNLEAQVDQVAEDVRAWIAKRNEERSKAGERNKKVTRIQKRRAEWKAKLKAAREKWARKEALRKLKLAEEAAKKAEVADKAADKARREAEVKAAAELAEKARREREAMAQSIAQVENRRRDLERTGQLDAELARELNNVARTTKQMHRDLGVVAQQAKAAAQGRTSRSLRASVGELDREASAASEAVGGFEHDVHPNGQKWWRYRYEYCFIESSMMAILVVSYGLVSSIVEAVSRASGATPRMAVGVDQDGKSILFRRWFGVASEQLAAVGAVGVLAWLVAQSGLYSTLARAVQFDEATPFQTPTDARDYRRLASDLVQQMMLAVGLYYAFMWQVVQCSDWKLLRWFEMEGGLAAPGRKSHASLGSADADTPRAATSAPEKGLLKPPVPRVDLSTAAARADEADAALPPLGSARESLKRHVAAVSVKLADGSDSFLRLKCYFADQLAASPEDGNATPRELLKCVQFHRYLALGVEDGVESILRLAPSTFFFVALTLVGFVALHFHAHLDYLIIFAGTSLLLLTSLGAMWGVIELVRNRLPDAEQARADAILRRAAQAQAAPDWSPAAFASAHRGARRLGEAAAQMAERRLSLIEHLVVGLFQYALFFETFGIARVLASPTLWAVYGRYLVAVACLTVVFIYTFTLVASLVPVFSALMSLPPWASKASVRGRMAQLV